MKKEFRVVWKRRAWPVSVIDERFEVTKTTEMFDPRPKTRRYATRKGAENFMLLLGPEPWKSYAPKASADDLVCCTGFGCGCGGQTYKEQSDKTREEIPEIEYVRLESREVDEWRLEE